MTEDNKGAWTSRLNYVGAIASVAGLVFGFFALNEEQRTKPILNTALVLSGGAAVVIAWVGVRGVSKILSQEKAKTLEAEAKGLEADRELSSFRLSCTDIHSVMHTLRDGLMEIAEARRPLDQETLVIFQRGTIEKTCPLIARIFSALAGCDVSACVSLCRSEGNRVSCFGWCHSRNEYHFTEGVEDLSVDAANTRFDVAARPNADGLSFFFAADLMKLGEDYRDQCRRWRERYRSCLVVPIRTGADANKLIGFLKLETLETDRLNGTYHRELLAAFADGICTYLKIGGALISEDLHDKPVGQMGA